MNSEEIKKYIRDIPDFPEKGVIFRDITTVLNNGEVFKAVIGALTEEVRKMNPDFIAAVDSRGFIIAAPIAYTLGLPFVPIRKPGKLPYDTYAESYSLEYGTNTVEIHTDAMPKGKRGVIADDLIATGGTLAAAVKLIERIGCEVVGVAAFIELLDLKGRDLLKDYNVFTLVKY